MHFDATHPISKCIDFLLGGELHSSRAQEHLVYREIDAGFAFRLNKFLTIELYYRYFVTDAASGHFSHENRLALATTVEAQRKRWYISDRNLGEKRCQQKRWSCAIGTA